MSTLKRPLDDAPTSPAKKLCLDDLKSNLDALLAKATEHHEEARLAAVDSAYDLEESWKGAEERKTATETELRALAEKRLACVAYEEKIKSSPSAIMLARVSESEVNGIDKLSEDHKKLSASLEQLRTLLKNLNQQHAACEKKLEQESSTCSDLKQKYEQAEANAEKITKLNERD
jgi:DNA repair exonuclease SbcCD ATPase subunit